MVRTVPCVMLYERAVYVGETYYYGSLENTLFTQHFRLALRF